MKYRKLETPMLRWAVCVAVILLPAPCLAEFAHRSDLSIRLDDTTDRSSRSQYRLRIRPEFSISPDWSLHGFIATGDRFGSAYNTFNDDEDGIHVRRLFARYEQNGSKIEVGVIPPYKGRVSSTGLSKEGWIRGARGVLRTRAGALELVVGDLQEIDADKALSSQFEVNYLEFEYSARIDESWSFEIGAEDMFEDRFVRGELRVEREGRATLAAELIRNTSTDSSKVVLSALKEFERPGGTIEWFTYYTYSDREFGQRAELAEDFLDFGHALATKLEGEVSGFDRFAWFAELEFYEDLSRIKLGLEVALN